MAITTQPTVQTTATDNQVSQTTATNHSYRQPSVRSIATDNQVSQPDHSYRQPSVPTRPQLQTTKCPNQTTATNYQVSQPDHSYRQPSVPTTPQLQTTKFQNQSYRRQSVQCCTPCVHYRAMLDDEPWIDEGSMVSGSQSVQFARHLI